MEQLSISVQSRPELGSNAVKQLRKKGRVPAVIYSAGEEAKSLSLDALEFSRIINAGDIRNIFVFKSDDKELDGVTSLVKDISIEPIKETITHIDFITITAGSKVTVTVPVTYVGEAPCVKLKTAILTPLLGEIEVECIPSKIPRELELDISELQAGDSLHVSDLIIPEGVELKSDPTFTVVSATIPRGVAEDEAAEGEGEEGEAESAEGEAAAPAEEKKES